MFRPLKVSPPQQKNGFVQTSIGIRLTRGKLLVAAQPSAAVFVKF
jgi:hypothetical protein